MNNETRKQIKNILKRRDKILALAKEITSSSINSGTDKNDAYYLDNMLNDIDIELSKYLNNPVAEWLLQIKGVTIDIAAGLLAYFNIEGKTRAAQFIKYAGSDNHGDPHSNSVRKIMERLSDSLKSQDALYSKLNKQMFSSLLNEGINPITARIRADRYMKKVFISHLFEEMYREQHNGELPERYNDDNRIIIEPEVQYTR